MLAGGYMSIYIEELALCPKEPDKGHAPRMILTEELASSLWKDRVLLTRAVKAPGPAYYGSMKIGTELKITSKAVIEERAALYQFPYRPSVGGASYSGISNIGMLSYSYSPLPEPMTVGRYCSISSGLAILDSHHPLTSLTTSIFSFRPNNVMLDGIETKGLREKIGWHIRDHKDWPRIGHDVWIGRDVTLSLGITIGTGAVLAAGAMVTKNVEPYSIVGANPARHIRYRIEDAGLRAALLETSWWEMPPTDLMRLDPSDPAAFVKNHQAAARRGDLRRYQPAQYVFSPEGVKRIPAAYAAS